jgi:transposase
MNRNEQMAEYYKRGWTLERIGQKYGITRERVRQIVKKQGLTWKDGGQRANHVEGIWKNVMAVNGGVT